MRRSTVFVLNGIHAAGKSTVGAFLRTNGHDYCEEIADGLLEQDRFNGSHLGTRQFQHRVFNRERHRDQEILDGGTKVIETWHPGNIAHAHALGHDQVAAKEHRYFQRVMTQENLIIVPIYLDIPIESMWDRSDRFEKEDRKIQQFYLDISDRIRRVYERYNLDYIVIDACAPPDVVANEVSEVVRAGQQNQGSPGDINTTEVAKITPGGEPSHPYSNMKGSVPE